MTTAAMMRTSTTTNAPATGPIGSDCGSWLLATAVVGGAVEESATV